MELDNTIVLRPRFHKEVPLSIEQILEHATQLKEDVREDYRVKISGHHIFLFIILAKRRYYSPHLHIELFENEDKTTHIKCLFGPDQTVWTFFMFLHFIVAGIFLVFAMFACSDWMLKNPATNDLIVAGLMVVVWFLLYFIAKQIRYNGRHQIMELMRLFLKIID
ncbi:hypothetical protein [Flavobacterium aciduliphilum]|uniref:GTP-binding protein n=1 Tax=Flavobacterium aciduliphilum TaxID=1101402 RepID=A0A328YEL1_9FLAO|nr:hypothetical protein [Flavobacterium aciduliphilum]RAR71583.1 hypothetical protein CLV55_107140 [Flavobacterium aciduliphilum]